ncbi:MAG: hypothetical protein HZC55_19220 [Verrucomicrobia bacterium]|nr:hypothetical protein [Verrucomicrobiota bacterium]
MFLGHFGVGFALKRTAPVVSLGTLFLAAQFIDLLWPTLLLLKIEHAQIAPAGSQPPIHFTDYPISHSLAMVAVWAVLFGGGYFLLRRERVGAIICGVAVLSHWALDLLVHHPDLPLLPGSGPKVGFGLWSSLTGSLVLELALFAAGTWLYLRATEAVDRLGSIGTWALVLFLLTIHLGNVFGPPPPDIAAVAWVGQAQWLLVLAGYWIDAHRRRRAG